MKLSEAETILLEKGILIKGNVKAVALVSDNPGSIRAVNTVKIEIDGHSVFDITFEQGFIPIGEITQELDE